MGKLNEMICGRLSGVGVEIGLDFILDFVSFHFISFHSFHDRIHAVWKNKNLFDASHLPPYGLSGDSIRNPNHILGFGIWDQTRLRGNNNMGLDWIWIVNKM